MNPRMIYSVFALVLAAGLGTSVAGGPPQYAKYLTVSDVQRVTGLKDVSLLPKHPGADEDLTFADRDGNVIVAVTFLPANSYKGARSSVDGVKSAIKDVGEEGFVGPASGPPLYILVFRKADFTVILNTELEETTKARIPIEQLTAIAKIIASRM